jgi:hypothetical protein
MADLCLDDFLEEEFARVKTLIVAYDTAISALSSGAQSYSLNTGQTTVTKTKANISSMRDTRAQLLNELSVLEARLTGRAAARVIPAW